MLTAFGTILYELRVKNHEETLRPQAQILGVSGPALKQVLCGKAPRGEDWVEKICEAYDIPVEAFQKKMDELDGAVNIAPEYVEDAPAPENGKWKAICEKLKEVYNITTDDLSTTIGYPKSYFHYLDTNEDAELVPSFLDRLKYLYPDAVNPVLSQYEKKNTSVQTVSLKGRTLLQRGLCYEMERNIIVIAPNHAEEIMSILSEVDTSCEVTSNAIPVADFLTKRASGHKIVIRSKGSEHILETAGMDYRTISNVALGSRVLSDEEATRLARAVFQKNVSMAAGFRHLNEISLPELLVIHDDDALSDWQREVRDKFYSVLPYITDDDANRIFEVFWKATIVNPARGGRTAADKRRQVELPFMEAIEWFKSVRKSTVSNSRLAEAIGIHASTLQRITYGSLELRYEQFRKICEYFNLDAMETEMFRHTAYMSRCMMRADMFNTTVEQRELCYLLVDKISLLDNKTIDEIHRVIVERCEGLKT